MALVLAKTPFRKWIQVNCMRLSIGHLVISNMMSLAAGSVCSYITSQMIHTNALQVFGIMCIGHVQCGMRTFGCHVRGRLWWVRTLMTL